MLINKQIIISFVICIICIVTENNVVAQKKCGADEFNLLLQKGLKQSENEKTFERWIKSKILNKKNQQSSAVIQLPTIYKIPVVFHIIHNGEALNSNTNISDAQIFSQMDSLNKDFRRLNADASDTPANFQPIAADVNIEFELAKRDPEGLPTTGIIRKEGNQSTYSINDPLSLTQQSYWPAEDYLNIWVSDISSGFLGFAQFPISNLEGLNRDQSISRLTDGVVLDWKFTGTNLNTGNFASLGRTATHEVGHYLGLRHIWGTSGCNSDDYCTDTPSQSSSSGGCPSEGSLTSCESEDMFQNFMDYTDDICMNLFTVCQSNRMRIIMENSPRRKSLLESKGIIKPVFVANDLGIREVIAPLNSGCSIEVIPQLEVRNYGSNVITDFTIELLIDEVLIETISKNVNLSYLETDFVAFSEIADGLSSTKEFKFQIVSTNLDNDGNSENNTKLLIANFPNQASIPYVEDFETTIIDWSLLNTSFDNSSMSVKNAPNLILDNAAFSFNYFESSNDKYGELDWLISPNYDLSALPTADFNFKYAYAPVSGHVTDVLTVAVSTDCGITFKEANYIFQMFSPSLGTSNTTNQSFIPSGPSDWRNVSLNLTDYAGNSNLVLAFIAHNGGGNNIYIDDIDITSDNILAYNLGIVEVNDLPLSSCSNDIFPTVEIKNFGFETINNFELEYSINGTKQLITTTGTTLLPGKSKSVFVPIKDLTNGSYQIAFKTLNPNGNTDEQPSNDLISRSFKISDYSDIIPIKEDFKNDIVDHGWDVMSLNDTSDLVRTLVSGNGINNNALFMNGFTHTTLGQKNWLISPQLDFTKIDSASLSFKISYANVIGRNDQLEVRVSTNCGLSFDHTVYSKKGSTLAIVESNNSWFPETKEDWRTEVVDLSNYTAWPNLKIAFVFTNQNGNNIFLDDIELFNQGSPTIFNDEKNLLRIYPNPARDFFNIKFDLETRDDLKLTLINMTGEIVFESEISNMLNQEYSINSLGLKNGMYLFHVKGRLTSLSKRVIIDN